MEHDENVTHTNDVPNNHGMGENYKFALPQSAGKMVDELTVDCVSINGIPFRLILKIFTV